MIKRFAQIILFAGVLTLLIASVALRWGMLATFVIMTAVLLIGEWYFEKST
jgi:hypothetical protein